jgi:hypothetical protein
MNMRFVTKDTLELDATGSTAKDAAGKKISA